MEIWRIDQTDREPVNGFILSHWYTLQMVTRGECIDLSLADGWAAFEGDSIIGLITFRITDREMEILSLDSTDENKGIGTALLEEAVREAKRTGCNRIVLITTNDNTDALRFYQKRGFDLVQIYRNALEESRKLKPEIPLVGIGEIPLRHEIELELLL